MMERLWRDILDRFGQEVVLRRDGGEVSLRALVQPWREKGEEQEVHSPLGLERRERFRYLGPADSPLDPDTVVVWKRKEYRVQTAHRAGEGVCPHWWAVLCPGEEAAL